MAAITNITDLNALSKLMNFSVTDFFYSDFCIKTTELIGSVAIIASAVTFVSAVILQEKLLLIGSLVGVYLGGSSWFYVREFRTVSKELNERITVEESAKKMHGQQQEIVSTVADLEKDVVNLRSSKEELEKKIDSFSKYNEELTKKIEVFQQKNSDFFELEKKYLLDIEELKIVKQKINELLVQITENLKIKMHSDQADQDSVKEKSEELRERVEKLKLIYERTLILEELKKQISGVKMKYSDKTKEIFEYLPVLEKL